MSIHLSTHSFSTDQDARPRLRSRLQGRQAVDLTAISQVESLLISLVKLIPPGVQHTTVLSSDGSIRYVYMPVDELYVVLLTPSLSNIIQDMDTLRLVGRIVSETCASAGGRGVAGEAEILRNSFELLSSFDEVIALGYRERIGIGEVRAAMEMESHEERIQEIIARNKEHEAKEELKRRAKQLEHQRKEAMKRGQEAFYAQSQNRSAYVPPPAPIVQHVGGEQTASPAASKTFKTKGMQLGAGKSAKTNDLIDALGGASIESMPVLAHQQQQLEEQQLAQARAHAQAQAQSHAQAAPVAEHPFGPIEQEAVHLIIRERVSLELSKDGGLNSFEAKGDLDFNLAAAENSRIIVSLEHAGNFGNDLQFKAHPNVDKNAWAKEKKLALRDASRGFPVGKPTNVLRWKLSTKSESAVPLSITCWPSPTDSGSCDVTLEYELTSDTVTSMRNVLISVPLPPGAFPTINSAVGTYSVNPETHSLDWFIESVDGSDDDSRSGTLEFNVAGDDTAAFFPIAVDFVSQQSLCGVQVLNVTPADGSGSSVEHSVDTLLTAEDYLVA